MEINTVIEELENASQQIKPEQIQNMITLLNNHARIFVYGTGRSGLMLKAFAMRLMQMGYLVYVIGETITPSVQKGDLLIVASASGETESVCKAADNAEKQGVNVATITTENHSTLSENHATTIVVNSATKYKASALSIQPLGSLFEQMLLIVFDSIILALSRNAANSNDEMAHKHANIE